MRFSGSHDLGLTAVLALAEELGQLPAEVVVWAVEGRRPVEPEAFLEPQLSAEVERSVAELAERIEREIRAGA